MENIKTDICIIGAGSGGLSVAAGAVQMGANVVLFEGHKMGGDCLNYGCIPSKALLAAGTSGMAFGKAMDHVSAAIETIAPHDSVQRFQALGVKVISQYGKFISPTQVQGGDTIITARRFVIATGSSPFVPPISGLQTVPYDTNETIFQNRAKPKHLLVVGGGPIGMEMAQAHRRLGCEVTVIDTARALGREDPEMAAIVLDNLRNEGVEIVEDAMVQQVRGQKAAIEIELADGRIFKGSHLLIAVGRQPNLDRLNLQVAGIEHHRGGIKVGANLRSTNKRVYAIGDVAGGLQFTHVAGYHAGVVLKSMLFGLPAKAKTAHIPWAIYTDPELAQVGLTEAQAKEKHGHRLEVVRFDFAGNDRLITARKAKGLIKLMVVKGRPVGVSIVGPLAGELIGVWAVALANNMKMGAIAATVLPYPTVGEVNKRAAGAYFAPRLFESTPVKRVVGFVQRFLP